MPQKLIDMSGQRVGRLTVIKRADKPKGTKPHWVCLCDCGNTTIVSRRHLKDHSTVSCGCYRIDFGKERKTHGMKGTRLYRIWTGMKDRCCNPNSKYWDKYGGRGINVCEEWKNSFESFYEWSINNGYTSKLTLDRADNDGDYDPNNCRWATYKEQENNRRNNVYLEYGGKKLTAQEWGEFLGIKPSIIRQRVLYGWDIERALTQEVRTRNVNRK